MRRIAPSIGLALLLAGCGAAAPPAKQRRAGGIPRQLLSEARPIGRGPRFEPPVRGRMPGACTTPLGHRLRAHIELFAANRVVLLPAGIGTRPPRVLSDGRLVHAGCFGAVVTLDPTGTVYFQAGHHLTVGDVFRAWGQRLGPERIASFTGSAVRVYVNGTPRRGSAGEVTLTRDAEIVLEVGPRVPPHARFTFPPGPPATFR